MNESNVVYICDVLPWSKAKRKSRSCLFQCACGKTFKSVLSDVLLNKRKSCGCRKGNKPNIYKPGEFINGIKFIRSLGTVKYAQRAIFECPICKKEWESLVGNIKEGHSKSCCNIKRGWSKSEWQKRSKTAKLYKVRLYNETESFVKIGMTTKDVKQRFVRFPYEYEIIKVIEGDSGYIFDLENKTKKLFKKYKYTPLINFKGETECYTY